jgi:hypothetical protein
MTILKTTAQRSRPVDRLLKPQGTTVEEQSFRIASVGRNVPEIKMYFDAVPDESVESKPVESR